MKKFVLQTAYFLIPLTVIAIIVEVSLRSIPNDYTLKQNYWNNNVEQIENLILGSSHAYYGLNPEHFTDPTFNAAYVSQSLDFDLMLLNKFGGQMKALKNIVLPVSAFTFFADPENNLEAWRSKNYVVYYNLTQASTKYTDYSELLSQPLKDNLERLYNYYYQNEATTASSALGWGANYLSQQSLDLIETGKTAAQRHSVEQLKSLKNKRLFEYNQGLLTALLSWCQKNDVQLILFTPPAFESYRQALNPLQVQMTISTAKSYAAAEGCLYLNYFGDPAFTENDFFDADHLADTGAKKLSKMIQAELMR
jgi:hypothetical protein